MAPTEMKEQDGYLPIANVSRIMKKSLPSNAKISKEAKQTVQECVSEFINFITGEASDRCQREKRKTVNGDDLLWAMTTLGFENYVGTLKDYLNKYRETDHQEGASSPARKIENVDVGSDSIVSMSFAASPNEDHDLRELKTFNNHFLGVGSQENDSKRSCHRIEYGDEVNVMMRANAEDFENGRRYAFRESSKMAMASIHQHGFEW